MSLVFISQTPLVGTGCTDDTFCDGGVKCIEIDKESK